MTCPTALRTAATLAVLLAGLVITPIALSHLDDNLRVVETQPVREVEVVAVYSPTLHTQLTTVLVRHPDTGAPTNLEGADKLVTLPAANTYVPVVVDPEDRTKVLITTANWAPTWLDYTTTVAATALPALTLAALLSGTFTRRRRRVE
ncbi:hypothetical protein [Kribbella italica]|uniref:DUF3592 domain-containing protein n=1 Tax=Kribbella italica TaxID=1540520 RepID=A0A7W9JGW7_9ACTN|nr:hypothetical protein [Kribbella italica]MBB5841288.1 hypothetical protein [Kribbella italica]